MELKLLRMEVLQPDWQNGKTTGLHIRIHHGIEVQNMKDFEKEVKALSNAGNTLAADDKVFFTPWSEVPRYKFNAYAQDKPKLSRVITFSKATAVVVDPKLIVPSLQSNCWDYEYFRIPKTVFQYKDVIKLKKYDELPDYLWVKAGSMQYVQALAPISQGQIERFRIFEYGTYSDTSAIEEKVNVGNLVLNGGKKLLSDTVVLEEINQGIVIDRDMYDQLCNMLKSNDAQNVGLGMELMANADYRKSEFKLALLLNRFRNKIIGHKNSQLVNFRSLLNYFSKYNWQHGDVPFANSIVLNSTGAEVDYEERMTLVKETMTEFTNSLLQGTVFRINEVVINHSPKLSKSVELEEEEVGELEED